MDSIWYLALGYGVIWLMLFAYLFSIAYREQELGRDVRTITQILKDREEAWSDATADEDAAAVAEGRQVDTKGPYRAT